MMRLFFSLFFLTGLFACSTGRTQVAAQASPSPASVTPEPNPTPEANASPALAKVVPKSTYNSVNVDGPYLALTFDDGPHKTLTPKLLDILKSRGVKATFFVLGQNVREYPAIARRIVEEGHEIANHSWSHPSFVKLSSSGVRSQIDRTSEAIKEVTGARARLLRPPYGALNDTVRGIIESEGLKNIMWSVDPLDWKHRNSDRVAQSLITQAQPGAILLAHDIHATTVAAIPATLDKLLAEGFEFVTVSDLLALERPPLPKPSPSAAAGAAAAVITPPAVALPTPGQLPGPKGSESL